MADEERPERPPWNPADEGMMVRILGTTIALLSFAVVCLSGLVQGRPFVSVMQHSLVAMAIGGVAGVLLSLVVRAVVREGFDAKVRGAEPEDQAAQDEASAAEAASPEDAGAAGDAGVVGSRTQGEVGQSTR